MIAPIFTAALCIMFASLVGVFTVNTLWRNSITQHLPYLVSFSAGVFMFTIGFMTIEAFHLLENLLLICALVVTGYVTAWLIHHLMPAFHHHHDSDCHTSSSSSVRILLGDALHNAADGLILVPAFLVSPWLGVGTAISLFAHELLQEISEFFVLKSTGLSTLRALSYNFIVSSTILLGVLLGYTLSNTLFIQGVLLALAAGFFANIVFSDLLPHKHSHNKSNMLVHLLLIVAGLLLIGLINTGLTHQHTHTELSAPTTQQ